MDTLELKNEISSFIELRYEKLWELSNFIHDHAEIGFNEYVTSKKN